MHSSIETKPDHVLSLQRVQHVAPPVQRLDEGPWSLAEYPVPDPALPPRLAGGIQNRLRAAILQAQCAAAIGIHAQFQPEPRVAAVGERLDQGHRRRAGAAWKRGRAK